MMISSCSAYIAYVVYTLVGQGRSPLATLVLATVGVRLVTELHLWRGNKGVEPFT
jgi:hypothetical protein